MKISAEIDDRIVDVKLTRPDGRRVAKTIPIDVFCRILSSDDRSNQNFTIYPPGMRFNAKMGPRVIVGFEEPETTRKITYIGSVDGRNREQYSWNVKLPPSMTIVEFVETGSSGALSFRRFYQLALKVPFFGLDTPLFMWPFSNVYDDGSCCLGGIRIPDYPSIKDTVGVVNIFHQGTYNGDLSSNRINTFDPPEGGASITNPFMLWRYLQHDTNPKPFPFQVLKSMSSLRSFLSQAGFGSILP